MRRSGSRIEGAGHDHFHHLMHKIVDKIRGFFVHRYGFVIVCAAISSIASLAWLRSIIFALGTPNFVHDWTWPPLLSQVTSFFPNRIGIWWQSSLGGYNIDSISYAPLVIAALSARLIGSDATCKALLFLAAVVSFLGAALLARKYSRDPIGAVAIGLFYAFGPVAINKVASGQVNAWVAYACLPYVFAQVPDFRAPTWRTIGACAFFFAFIASQPHVMLYLALIVPLLAWAEGGLKAALAAALAWLLGAATQTITVAYLMLSARENTTGQLIARIPWQVDQSLRWLDALTLSGYFTHYYESALGQLYQVAWYLLLACAVAALTGFAILRNARFRAVLFCITAVLLAAASSFHSFLFPYASSAFLRHPILSIFRELYNVEEIIAVLFCIGIASLVRVSRVRIIACALPVGVALLSLTVSFYSVLHPVDLRAHLAAAEFLEKQPGIGRVWPIPNGRFLSRDRSRDGGFDPFWGRIGLHNVLEEYFPEQAVRVASSRPIQTTLPLLRAMNVEFLWIRRDWTWRPAGGNAGVEYLQTCPSGTTMLFDTPSDRICRVTSDGQRVVRQHLRIVPDLWSAGLSALGKGEDFVFARDSSIFGVREDVLAPPDDRRFVDAKSGIVSTEIGPINNPQLSEIAGASSFVRDSKVSKPVLSNSLRYVITDGIFEPSAARRVAPDTFITDCRAYPICEPARASFVIFSGAMRTTLTRAIDAPLRNVSVLIDRSEYVSSLQARVDNKILPHVRVDGMENGWIVPLGQIDHVEVVNTDATPLVIAQASTIAVWLTIVGLITVAPMPAVRRTALA